MKPPKRWYILGREAVQLFLDRLYLNYKRGEDMGQWIITKREHHPLADL
jgi:hypothetical protein